MTAPIAVTVLSYALSYQRYRRLMVEGGVTHHAPRREGGALFSGGWLLERWIGDPREQAVFAFIWKTLVRSRSHRLILLAYAGIGLGCITKGALDTPRPSLHDQGLYGFIVVVAPLAIAIAMAAGLRYLFSLPLALGANWLFQMTEPEDRAAWLSAVERFVLWCGIAPVFPGRISRLRRRLRPGARAGRPRRWRSLPCSSFSRSSTGIGTSCLSPVPGCRERSRFWSPAARVFYAAVYSASVAQLILYSSGELTAFVAVITFEVVVWSRLRAKRRGSWAQAAMAYEDTSEEAPILLGLPQTMEGVAGAGQYAVRARGRAGHVLVGRTDRLSRASSGGVGRGDRRGTQPARRRWPGRSSKMSAMGFA